MITLEKIEQVIEAFAPSSLAEAWDNVGLLAGDRAQPITHVLCALDITEQVVEEAIAMGAQLIVAHHPVIFTSVNRITADTATGRVLRAAIAHNIAMICMHTNADCAWGGVNDALAARLSLTEVEPMGAGEQGLLGRVGNLSEAMPPLAFARFVKERLGAGGVRVSCGSQPISRVAVGGGACGKLMDYAKGKGAQAFVIGDSSYDLMQRAQAIDLTLVDAGHFPTENPITDVFADLLRKEFPTLKVCTSAVHKDCIAFV